MYERDDVRNVYISRLGEPAREATFQDRTVSVDILKWEPSQVPDGGVYLYLTLGASRISIGPAQHRVEFYLGLDREVDDVAPILAEFAAEPVLDGELLDAGHTVTFPAPIWKGAQFRTLMVFQSGKPPIPDTTMPDESHLSLRGLMPLHPSELEEKQRVGFDDLWSRFAAKEVPFWDPTRPPAIPGQASARLSFLGRLCDRR